MADFRYPENVCIRFVRNGTEGLRVDLYEALDGFFNGVTDQGPCVKNIGKSIFLSDILLEQPVSAFLEKINEATKYGVRR